MPHACCVASTWRWLCLPAAHRCSPGPKMRPVQAGGSRMGGEGRRVISRQMHVPGPRAIVGGADLSMSIRMRATRLRRTHAGRMRRGGTGGWMSGGLTHASLRSARLRVRGSGPEVLRGGRCWGGAWHIISCSTFCSLRSTREPLPLKVLRLILLWGHAGLVACPWKSYARVDAQIQTYGPCMRRSPAGFGGGHHG